MSRMTKSFSLLTAALFLGTGAWWLSGMALQVNGGFAAAPAFSAHASFVLVLGQLLMISLFMGQTSGGSPSDITLSALCCAVPLWPLIALLWLTSDLPLAILVASQVAALLLAGFVVLGGLAIDRVGFDRDQKALLRSATGVLVAAIVWAARNQIHEWITV